MRDGRARYLISYGPSARLLAFASAPNVYPRADASLLAIVNPTEDLPAAPAEGAACAGQFRQSKVLAGPDATIEALRGHCGRATHLHFACHGSADLEGALYLADAALSFDAIAFGHLPVEHCRLVTLSACETGMARLDEAPDEMVSLAGAFLQAGSRPWSARYGRYRTTAPPC